MANGLQPFHWIPKIISGGAFHQAPLVALPGLTLVLMSSGLAAFRQRDLAA